MRNVTAEFLYAANASNSPISTCDVWLGGEVIRADAKIVSGQVEYESDRDVEGRLTLVLLDDESEGSRLSQVIHAIGTQVNVRAGFDLSNGPEAASMGWFDVTDVVAVDEWEWFDWADKAMKKSSVVSISGLDLMNIVANSPFLTPTQPSAGSDAWAAIAGLCQGIVSVLDPGFTPTVLPAGLVFEWDRLAAIKAIAALWNAKPVMTDAGQLTLAAPTDGDVIDDFGVKINLTQWQNQSNSENLHNGVTFLGKAADGSQLVGTATENSGPSVWGGSFGYRPLQASSDLMTTQAMVNAAAQTRLDTEILSRAVTQAADALWNPAVELRDRPTLQLPDRPVPTQVFGYTLPLTGGAMSVTLRLPLLL